MARQSDIPASVLEKFILGFDGSRLPDELCAYLEGGLAGVIVFPRNFSTLRDLLALTREIRHIRDDVFIGIDQEGGARFSLPEPFTQWPSATELGLLDESEATEKIATALALELNACGCNLDFAPMLDLHIQPESPVTRQRSFGDNPEKVGELGAAFARGLAAGGVLACAKHFPGHGDTKVDPHNALPVFDGRMSRLSRMELVPFALAIQARVPVIMTAHIILPQIDPGKPATLSRKILHGLLRETMRFEGVILADDLGMGAIRSFADAGRAAVETFSAGSDVAMLCHEWKEVQPALVAVTRAVDAGHIDESELEASGRRIQSLRAALKALPDKQAPFEIVGCAAHRSLAEDVRAQLKR